VHVIGGLAGALGGPELRDVAAVLVAHGGDVNGKPADGQTPLIHAVIKGDAEWAKLLVDAGAEINARGPRGWTALHFAAAKGHTEIARLLLAAGADTSARNDAGAPPLEVAKGGRMAETLRR